MPELLLGDVPPPSGSSSCLLDRLKIETRPIHQRLEKDLDLLGDRLSSATYRQTLGAFYGFYQPFEERAYSLLPDALAPVFANRRKAPKLARDLRFFGIAPEAVVLCAKLPKLENLPALLGAAYVTEGATLGGQIISRHLEANLGLRDGQGYAFFSSYGAQVGAMWKDFRARLLEYSSPALDPQIVAGAIRTFSAMHDWLCRGKAAAV